MSSYDTLSYRAVGRSENLGGQAIQEGHIMEYVLVLFLLKSMGYRGGNCPPRPTVSDGPCHLMTLWEWKQPLTDDWTHISQPTRECWTIKRMGPSHHDNVVAEKWQKPRFVARRLHTRVWNCRNKYFWIKLLPDSSVCSKSSSLGRANNDLGLF